MLKNNLKKLTPIKVLIILLIIHIYLFTLMLLNISTFFSAISSVIAISHKLVSIDTTMHGLTFITNADSFYFAFPPSIYIIALLIIDSTALIFYMIYYVKNIQNSKLKDNIKENDCNIRKKDI